MERRNGGGAEAGQEPGGGVVGWGSDHHGHGGDVRVRGIVAEKKRNGIDKMWAPSCVAPVSF